MKIIVAKDEKGGIGLNGRLPWHIKEDLQRFATLTRGHLKAVLMGRNTWESLPKRPLIGRHNLVLSSTYTPDGEKYFNSIESVLSFIKTSKFEEVWIIGGEKLYTLFLTDMQLNKLVEQVYVTEVPGDYGCDTKFPELDADQYILRSCEFGVSVVFKVYDNKNYASVSI